MPGLTPERITFLNQQLKKQGILSYVQIEETQQQGDAPKTYKLVRRTYDTGETIREFSEPGTTRSSLRCLSTKLSPHY